MTKFLPSELPRSSSRRLSRNGLCLNVGFRLLPTPRILETIRKAPEGRHNIAWGVSPRWRSEVSHTLFLFPPRVLPQLRAVPGVGAALGVEGGGFGGLTGSWGSRPRLYYAAPFGAQSGFPDSLVSREGRTWDWLSGP